MSGQITLDFPMFVLIWAVLYAVTWWVAGGAALVIILMQEKHKLASKLALSQEDADRYHGQLVKAEHKISHLIELYCDKVP